MNKSTKQGFTIIEVVLVLAIAALIFLMAFVAFPALQRTQRDTARKNAVSTVVAAGNDFLSNNRGDLTQLTVGVAGGSGTLNNYIKETTDAGYSVVAQVITGETSISSIVDTITIYKQAKCGNSGKVVPGSSRQFAVATYLESKAYFCQEG